MQKAILKALQIITGIVILVVLVVNLVDFDHISTWFDPSNCNYKQLKEVLVKKDSRNTGLEIQLCKNDETLTFDMVSIKGDKSRTDVFRYILQAAEELQYERFDRVEFAYQGNSKFYISGTYFKTLGDEYDWQNAIYTSRTFTENVRNMAGTKAFGNWSGGTFDVLEEQMSDHNKFHDQWYVNELSK